MGVTCERDDKEIYMTLSRIKEELKSSVIVLWVSKS